MDLIQKEIDVLGGGACGCLGAGKGAKCLGLFFLLLWLAAGAFVFLYFSFPEEIGVLPTPAEREEKRKADEKAEAIAEKEGL